MNLQQISDNNKYVSDVMLEDFAVLTKITSIIFSGRLLHKFKTCWLADRELSISLGPSLTVTLWMEWFS